MYYNELYHHGIRGQKWGVKHGPPYPLSGGTVSSIKTRNSRIERKRTFNKKYKDDMVSTQDTFSTLSYDPNRTKDAQYMYATYKFLDKKQYEALFNKPIPKEITNEKGEVIGRDNMLKYRINNKVKNDMKIASEDSSAKVFTDLYKKDRDFYNFINDPERMEKYFDSATTGRHVFKGYRESKQVLQKMKNPNYTPTENDLKTVYRTFNYIIPYDGAGKDNSGAKDVSRQRVKYFNEMKKNGYGAILDTNDALYGGFKATSPVIVFDMSNIIPDSITQTKMSEKRVAQAITAGRKMAGV